MPDDDRPGLRVIDGDGTDSSPIRAKPIERRPCVTHRDLVLDHVLRVVECGDCGHRLDAFDALVIFEHEQHRYQARRDNAAREVKRHTDELERLKRDESNTRARRRRLADGSSDLETVLLEVRTKAIPHTFPSGPAWIIRNDTFDRVRRALEGEPLDG